jgi:hypothetical protein
MCFFGLEKSEKTGYKKCFEKKVIQMLQMGFRGVAVLKKFVLFLGILQA